MSALIVVNFKTYASAQGEAAVSLAKAMVEVDSTTDATTVSYTHLTLPTIYSV